MHQKDQNLGSKSIFVNMRRIRNHSYRSQGGGHLFIRLRTSSDPQCLHKKQAGRDDLQEHGGLRGSCATKMPNPAWVTLMSAAFLMLPAHVYYLRNCGQGLWEPHQV